MNSRLRKFIKIVWISFTSLIIVIILFFIGVSLGMLGPIPSFEELENPRSNLASEIYSSDGVLLGKFYIENRTNVEYSDLPEHLVLALIATEDIRYHKHSGVDARGLIRAFTGLVFGKSGSGGASTITQQLAKNLFERPKGISTWKLITIKIREWVTSVKLERNYSKEEIVTMYFNTMDFGSQAFGINSASQTYFGKSPDSLLVEEAAVLVGMLKAPTYYNPVRNPDNSFYRRNIVLAQMMKYGFMSRAEFDSIKELPINTERFQIQDHTAGSATYFREYLRMQMTAKEPVEKNFNSKHHYDEAKEQWDSNPLYGWCYKNKKPDGTFYNIYKDGLKIYTTIDSRMQVYAEEVVEEHLKNELQPAFYKEWKGVRNAPWDFRMKQADIDEQMNIMVRRSDRFLSMRKDGIPEEMILKSFDVPIQMQLFSWDGYVDTVMTPRDSIMYYLWFLQAGFVAIV